MFKSQEGHLFRLFDLKDSGVERLGCRLFSYVEDEVASLLDPEHVLIRHSLSHQASSRPPGAMVAHHVDVEAPAYRR